MAKENTSSATQGFGPGTHLFWRKSASDPWRPEFRVFTHVLEVDLMLNIPGSSVKFVSYLLLSCVALISVFQGTFKPPNSCCQFHQPSSLHVRGANVGHM